MDVNIEQLTQLVEDEIIKNLKISVVREDDFYEPCDSYKVTLTYKGKVISVSNTIAVPRN